MKQNLLDGQIGTDPNFTLTTHTGHSKADAKHLDEQPVLQLTPDEQAIFDGKKGAVLQKAMNTRP